MHNLLEHRQAPHSNSDNTATVCHRQLSRLLSMLCESFKQWPMTSGFVKVSNIDQWLVTFLGSLSAEMTNTTEEKPCFSKIVTCCTAQNVKIGKTESTWLCLLMWPGWTNQLWPKQAKFAYGYHMTWLHQSAVPKHNYGSTSAFLSLSHAWSMKGALWLANSRRQQQHVLSANGQQLACKEADHLWHENYFISGHLPN